MNLTLSGNQISDYHEIVSGENEGHKRVAHRTIFNEILTSSLPPQEKSIIRLQQEAAGIVGAAIETTKATLTFAPFYIISNSQIKRRLFNELHTYFPDISKSPTLPELEQLPYLTAIIQEGTSPFISIHCPRMTDIPEPSVSPTAWPNASLDSLPAP